MKWPFALLLLLGCGLGVTRADSQWHKSQCADNRVVIVHLFEWKWKDIAAECERFLGPMGYCGVQLSPPMEHAIVTTDAMHPWWQRYQPVSYKLDSRSGSEAEFADMVKRCNNAKVRIYADAVVNHMTGVDRSGVGSGGSHFKAEDRDFPGVPYRHANFNPRSKCNSPSGSINNYGDPTQVRNCMLVGLVDLDQSVEDTRNKIVAYFNKMIDYGVAGFRVDASKHMWPEDILAIQKRWNNLNTKWFPAGSKPFVVHEVIDMSNEPIRGQHYSHLGRVTDFRYCIKIRETVDNPWNLRSVYDPGWGMLPPEDAFVFVDNHDNQRGHGASGSVVTHKDPHKYKRAVAFTIANDYGYPRIMSSYTFENDKQGPPHNPDYSTKDVVIKSDGTCADGWVCEHRWGAIANMAGFAKAVAGTKVENWQGVDGCGTFSRGNKGFFAICNSAGLNRRMKVNLPAGTYCNVISGPATPGGCSGDSVQVDGSGMAQVTIKNNDEPMFAIHVEARSGGGPPVTDTPTTARPSTPEGSTAVPRSTPQPDSSTAPPTAAPATTSKPDGSMKRTVVFLQRHTQSDQDVFIRGGINGDRRPGCGGEPANDPCSIPITHHSLGSSGHYDRYNAWRAGDRHLDWGAAEPGQGSADWRAAEGSPLVWTSNNKGHAGYQARNRWGDNYWMIEVDMDCSKTESGWFEFKGFLRNGGGWENDIAQVASCGGTAGGSKPYSSSNHFARCGFVNVFTWGNNGCTIDNL